MSRSTLSSFAAQCFTMCCFWSQMLRIWRVEQFIQGGGYHMHTAILRSHWCQWNPRICENPSHEPNKNGPHFCGQRGSKWLWTREIRNRKIMENSCAIISIIRIPHVFIYVPSYVISWSKRANFDTTWYNNHDSKWSASQRGHRYGSHRSSCPGALVQSCCLPALKHHIEEPTQKPRWQIVKSTGATNPTSLASCHVNGFLWVYDFRMPFLSLGTAWYTHASGLWPLGPITTCARHLYARLCEQHWWVLWDIVSICEPCDWKAHVHFIRTLAQQSCNRLKKLIKHLPRLVKNKNKYLG